MNAHRTPCPDQLQTGAAWLAPADWRQPMVADQACCCSARPDYLVVVPVSSSRDYPTDLLLCGHHYRVSRPVLASAGIAAFGLDR
jgi:hypothetical protein